MSFLTRINCRYILLLGGFISVLFFPFSTSYGYFTTSQDEILLENHSALFLIEYAFGTKKHELSMPLLATSNSKRSDSVLSYTIIDTTGSTTSGETSGIVLSDAMINTSLGMYTIPSGISKKSTLAVVFTPDQYIAGQSYRLQITHLPFLFDAKQKLQLNPSELQYYTTKLLAL